MNNDIPDAAPNYELCNNTVMIECGQLMNVRQEYPRLWRPRTITNMRELLERNIRTAEVL